MKNANKNELEEILSYVESQKSIPQERIMTWMKSEDIEVLGVTFYIFNQRQHLIKGFPSRSEIVQFYIHFFRRCLQENPSGDYSLNRSIAGYTLMNYYKALRNDPAILPELLQNIREMIKDVYENGNKDIKENIIYSVLEHLFEDDEVAMEFADWKQNVHLKDAYMKALEYSQG